MLATMPLHAITEVYGEPGLRERFAYEIRDFAAPDRERLAAALDLATTLHHGQRRVREPYVNHLLRVAIRILHYYGVRDVDVVVAALLHDSAEDQAERLAGVADTDLALARLGELFGPRVASLVESVTNPEYTTDRSEHEQYREHVAESLERDPWARVIKVSDFTDNGVGVIHTTGPKVRNAATKYGPLIPVFRDLVTRPDTPLDDRARAHILGQLALAETRFAAILDSSH
jgi:(p)ppGpp synthase/HD superfamily hydrolase